MSGATEIPMLAPIMIWCPWISYGAPTTSTRRLASDAASNGCGSRPACTMANSSPPSLETVSLLRTHVLRRQATSVKIDTEHGDLLIARYAMKGLLQLFTEQPTNRGSSSAISISRATPDTPKRRPRTPRAPWRLTSSAIGCSAISRPSTRSAACSRCRARFDGR